VLIRPPKNYFEKKDIEKTQNFMLISKTVEKVAKKSCTKSY
jgi:hypothetical protein